MIYLPEHDNRINEAVAYCKQQGVEVKTEGVSQPISEALYGLNNDEYEAVVCGLHETTANVIKQAIKTVGLKDEILSSYFIMQKGEEKLFFADCAVVSNPSSGQLAQIAIQTADSARQLGVEPNVAFLSYSTLGSAKTAEVEKIKDAVKILGTKDVVFSYTGELQFDSAYNETVRKQKIGETALKPFNVFIFPDLNSGNIGYKIAQQLGNYTATGPMLQGLNKTINDLSRGSTVDDIIQVIMITNKLIK